MAHHAHQPDQDGSRRNRRSRWTAVRGRGEHARRLPTSHAGQATPRPPASGPPASGPPASGRAAAGRPAAGRAAASRSRLLTPLLHALFFVAAATQSAIVPLLPRMNHAYGLNPSADALLLAAPGLATLAISMPAGALAERLGPRRVTLAATALITAAALAQAAPSHALLITGRFAFGLAFGIVWTTGVAWMSGSHDESGSPKLGAVATSAAVGMVAGPAIGGVLADQLGLAAPFLVVAILSAALALALRTQPPPRRRAAAAVNTRLRDLPAAAARSTGVLTGATVLAISGAVGGVTQLLVPLELHRAGFSAGATGVAFSAAAGVYIVVSALVVKLGRRATTARFAAMAGLALAISLLPAAFENAALALIGVVVLSTIPRAAVSTVAYPLATDSAARAQLADGLVIGLLNGTWAIGLVLAPLLAGAIDELAGPGPAYLATIVPAALTALWLLARRGAKDTPREDAAQTLTCKPPTAEHELVSSPA